MNHHQCSGNWVKQIVAEHLVSLGCERAGRKARTPHGEIVIVTRQAETTFFVEVKSWTSNKMGFAEEIFSKKSSSRWLPVRSITPWNMRSINGKSM